MSSLTVDSIQELLSATTIAKENKLSFAGKGLKLNTEDDAKDIEREIFEFEANALEVLCLEGNTIGIDAAKAIARGLSNHPEFKRALWSDIFTGRLKTEIPPALNYLSDAMMTSGVKLVELDLSDNAFGPNGIEGIKDLLKSETCYTLEVLKLNNNGLGTFGGKILANCLMECYDSSCKTGTPLGLKVFVSGRGRLENEGAKCLAAVFKKMGTLEHVAMPQNGIQYPGIIELSDAFAHCKKLMHLNLNDNTFTVEGAKAMAKALPKLQSLQILNFGDCLIRTEGAVLLSQALKDGHEDLQELILCGNEIKKEGGIAVATILSNKKCLQKVELGANNFGQDGVNEIKSMFKTHKLEAALDNLSDDDGSEVDEEEDKSKDVSDQETEEDDVQVIEADTANIEEDASITNEVSSPLSPPRPEIEMTSAVAVPTLSPDEDALPVEIISSGNLDLCSNDTDEPTSTSPLTDADDGDTAYAYENNEEEAISEQTTTDNFESDSRVHVEADKQHDSPVSRALHPISVSDHTLPLNSNAFCFEISPSYAAGGDTRGKDDAVSQEKVTKENVEHGLEAKLANLNLAADAEGVKAAQTPVKDSECRIL